MRACELLRKAIACCARAVLPAVPPQNYRDRKNHNANDENPGSHLLHDIPLIPADHRFAVRFSPSIPAIIPKIWTLGVYLAGGFRGYEARETGSGIREPL